MPSFGEKLITAFTRRRELLSQSGVLGLRVVGPGRCRDTNTVREFLYKNFVPFTWFDTETEEGRRASRRWARRRKTPVIECGNGRVLVNPSLQELASEAGIWKHCPSQEVDLAIVGAGPAGIAAAVYASSEGISTLMLDRLGPGGQAGGSSRIENFIGFPAGLSGADLATRGVLQMLKFGARIVAPVAVEKLIPAQSVDELHVLQLDCGAEIRCRVMLLALGVRWRRLEAAGADRFAGAGHLLCLHDGGSRPLRRRRRRRCRRRQLGRTGRHVSGRVLSDAHRAFADPPHAGARHVGILVRARSGRPPTCSSMNRPRSKRFMEIITWKRLCCGTTPRKLQRRVPCSAVFVFIGAEPSAEWLPADIARDANGYLLTGTDVVRSGLWPRGDRDPCPLETTVPGVLAAGDIRSGSTKRVGFAVGDGSLAVTCAHRLLSISR